jgi:hypothetical protein
MSAFEPGATTTGFSVAVAVIDLRREGPGAGNVTATGPYDSACSALDLRRFLGGGCSAGSSTFVEWLLEGAAAAVASASASAPLFLERFLGLG